MRITTQRAWCRIKGGRARWPSSWQLCARPLPPIECSVCTQRAIQPPPGCRPTALCHMTTRRVEVAAILNTAAMTSPSEAAHATPGLYGIPGLHTPDNLITIAADIVTHCQELQLSLDVRLQTGPGGGDSSSSSSNNAEECGGLSHRLTPGPVSETEADGVPRTGAVGVAGVELTVLIRQHHEAVSWLRPVAEHCAAHHVEGSWREAANRALRALQAVEELLACRLATHSDWSQLMSGGPTAAPPRGTKQDSESTAPPASSAHMANVTSGAGNGSGEAGAYDRSGPSTGSGFRAGLEQLGGSRGESTVVDDRLRLVSEAISRASVLSDEEQQERRELEQLETRLIAAFRSALGDPVIAPMPLVVLHDSEVRSDPLLARHATLATEAEVAAAQANQSVLIPLVLPPLVAEDGGSTSGGTRANHGHEGPVAEVELGPVAAATRRARIRGGRLWSLRLTGHLTSLLLTEHPSIALRRAVQAVTHGSQAAAALRLMDVLRPLRDNLAGCFHQPSFAHLKMAGSVAADPRVALALLSDILSAVRPLADEEVASMQQLVIRLRLEEGEQDAEEVAEVYDPLDLKASVDFLTAAQRDPPLSAAEWRDLAPYFTIEGLLQGLSRQLSYMLGAELHASKSQSASELWNPQPHHGHHHGSTIRLELREKGGRGSSGSNGNKDGGNSGELLGVLYVYLDPDCDLPFTVLVRHGYRGSDDGSPAPWLRGRNEPDTSHIETDPVPRGKHQLHQHPQERGEGSEVRELDSGTGSSGACVPHVALHLPAGLMAHGSGGYLVPEHPGLIRTLVHELGHALHYMMSYSPGALPDTNACYSSTDFLELPSHIFERWVADPRVLSDLSCHAVSGARLPPRRCAAVATIPSRQVTWLELQQHTLAAAADLLMHMNGTIDLQQLRLVPHSHPPAPTTLTRNQSSPSVTSATAPTAPLLELQSTPTLELVSALWATHSSLPGGAFQPTKGLMALLPGFLHNGAAMYAYPAAQLVAAAIWERHFAQAVAAAAGSPSETAAAIRCGQLLRGRLLQSGHPGSAAAALEELLGPGCVQRVRLGCEEMDDQEDVACPANGVVGGWLGAGGACRYEGVIPDVAHDAFQGIDPLVF